jgi:hypothetical protein
MAGDSVPHGNLCIKGRFGWRFVQIETSRKIGSRRRLTRFLQRPLRQPHRRLASLKGKRHPPLTAFLMPALFGVNYFFRFATIIFPYQRQLLLRRRGAPPRAGAIAPRWGVCFLFSERASLSELWECGNLAAVGRDFQGARGKSGKPVFGFPRFPQPRHFHSSFLLKSIRLLRWSSCRPEGPCQTIDQHSAIDCGAS